MLIDPGVVGRLATAVISDAAELRSRQWIERPAFGAMLAGRVRAVERAFALAAVERPEMPAGERGPRDALTVDVATARRVTRQRDLVDFRERRFRRVRAGIDPHDRAGEAGHGAPDRAIHRRGRNRVEADADALVLGRVDRLVGLHIALVALAVAVGVEDERRPALRLQLVAGLVQHLSVDPAQHFRAGAARARPQRAVGVEAELHMVGREAGAHLHEVLFVGVVHDDVAVRCIDRERLRRRMIRASLADVGIGRRTNAGREPHPCLLIQHQAVRDGLRVPELLVAPIRRCREHRVVDRRGGLLIAHRQLDRGRGVLDRIEDRDEVGRVLGRPVERAVAIDRGIALVGGDLVVQVGLGARPVPHRDDDIALGALRTLRLDGWGLAVGDARGPVGQGLQAPLGAEPLDGLDHVLAGLAGLDAPGPSLIVRAEAAECLRQSARGLAADGVAVEAAVGLELAQERLLAGEFLVDAVAAVAGAGELALIGHLGHRQPVDRRIVFGGGLLVRRRHRGEVDDLARLSLHLGRIDQPIAAHPYVIIGLRKIGQHIAALVVGDHDLDQVGGKVFRFRDHPDAGFRTPWSAHDAAEIGRADADGRLLGVESRRRGGQECRNGDRGHAQIQAFSDRHYPAPFLPGRPCVPCFRGAQASTRQSVMRPTLRPFWPTADPGYCGEV